MNRNRILIGAAVAIFIGLLAGQYVYRQIQRAAVTKTVEMGHLVVAAESLPLGTRLTAQQLRVIPWPANEVLAGAFSKPEDCVNRALITSVIQNEPILEQKLAPKEAGAGLPAAIPVGMRAVSVRVDEVVGVAGFVTPETTVDVLVTGVPIGQGSSDNVTRTILEDVRVLAAGQKVEQDKDGKPQTVSVVTLLVTPEQADKLTMASTAGTIHLALRNTIDTKETNPPPVFHTALLLGETRAPRAARRHAAPEVKPKPKPDYVVEVIRGSQREVQKFPPQGEETKR
jgi:pilus assembly protein CpaB